MQCDAKVCEMKRPSSEFFACALNSMNQAILIRASSFNPCSLNTLAVWTLCCCLSAVASAEPMKCTDAGGRVTYQDGPCIGSTKAESAKIDSRENRSASKEKIVVATEVMKECYEGYRLRSLDPSKAEYLGHSASYARAGFPVLHISAVFRNKFGGPDRRLLWCRLTHELVLDRPEMEKAWRDEVR